MKEMTLLPTPLADPEGVARQGRLTSHRDINPDSGLSLATAISGTPGSGKTTLATVLGLWGLLNGWGQVLIDPTGSLSIAFLHQVYCFLAEFPEGEDELLWRKVRYIPLGATDSITPFPIYERREGETVWDASERLLRTLELSRPTLITQSFITWPRARRLASNAGAVLAALGFQLTEVADLLFNTLAFTKRGLFAEAITRCPEVAPAVSYFQEQYLPLSLSAKHSLTSTFLDHVYRFSQDPSLRLLFGGSQGIDLEETLETGRETVIMDCSGITDPDIRRFALLWIFQSLYGHIKTRDRRPYPLRLLVDEMPALAHKAAEGANPLADLLDEFCARYMRANQVFFTCCFQSLNQLPPDLQQTILRFGNLFVGRVGTLSEAKIWADEVLLRKDPMQVKYWHRVWAHEPVINSYSGRTIGTNHFVIDHRPEFMPLSEQTELAARRLVELPAFSFFARLATGEGAVSQSVSKLTIRQVTEDPETNEPLFPDETEIQGLKFRLAKRSGMPVATIREEIASRLAQGTIQKPPQRTPAAREMADVQPSIPPVRVQPEPQHAKAHPSLPPLAEEQKAFLAFLIEHPDMPVSGVYKGLGVSVRKGNDIRESLKQQGFLIELELKAGTTGAGRPMKCVLPSFQAFELFGIDPPRGRGSIIHRQLQKLVAEGAYAKGYKTELEKVLATGTIVDAHLEKDGKRIAVEIAIASKPDLEMAHIRNCLLADYNQIYGLFADENLLARTKQAVQGILSAEESEKVRLLPLRLLSRVG
jgi:hypothetical protein